MNRKIKNVFKKIYLFTFPYSLTDSTDTHLPGSFPSFRTGMKGTPSLMATIGAIRNPLASRPVDKIQKNIAKYSLKNIVFS